MDRLSASRGGRRSSLPYDGELAGVGTEMFPISVQQAIERAGDEPVRVQDPDTHTASVLIREDLYRKLREALPESDFTSHEFEELIPSE
jgi:hypothetical protein